MNNIVDFYLITETTRKDSTGQVITDKSQTLHVGKRTSVYQSEFFKADQAGLRSQGVIEMSSFDYSGEKLLLVDGHEYTIYRTYAVGTDRIQLYYGERVGNTNG